MSICKSEAIVLKTTRLGETSKIITVFSDLYGKFKLVAKGSRRPGSKFGASLDLFSHISIVFYRKEQSELKYLSESNIISSFQPIRIDVKRVAYASAVVELVNRLTAEEDPHPQLFIFLEKMLIKMAECDDSLLELLLWYFEIKIAELLGYKPELQKCVSCKYADFPEHLSPTEIHLSKNVVYFDISKGGVICSKCKKDDINTLPLLVDNWLFLKQLQKTKLSNLNTTVDISKSNKKEISELLSRFLQYHTDDHRKIKSLEFLKD